MFERRQGNLTFDRSSFTLCLRFVSIFMSTLIFGASKRMQTVSFYTDVVILFFLFFVLFENPKTLRRSIKGLVKKYRGGGGGPEQRGGGS